LTNSDQLNEDPVVAVTQVDLNLAQSLN